VLSRKRKERLPTARYEEDDDAYVRMSCYSWA